MKQRPRFSNIAISRVRRKRPIGKMITIIIIVLAVIVVAGFAAIPPIVMKDMVLLHVDVSEMPPEQFGVEAEEVWLTTEDGLRLISWEVKADDPRGIVIFLSGIHNPSVTAYFGHAKMMADNGYSSLLIEMRSHGRSEGSKIYVGTREYLDTKAGVEYIKSQPAYKDLPVIVFGVSMGGATAINSIGEIPDIDGLISVSAFSSWEDAFCDNMIVMGFPPIAAKMEKPFVRLYMGLEFGFGSIRISPVNEIKKLDGRPALLMHSTEDSQIPFASFERLKKAATGQVETFVRTGDHHMMCMEEHFTEPWKDEEYAGAILSFLEEHF
jgi:fermentation-respiration switch protein FrsA (DUF1100 family)